jgi:hypothetical protein
MDISVVTPRQLASTVGQLCVGHGFASSYFGDSQLVGFWGTDLLWLLQLRTSSASLTPGL